MYKRTPDLSIVYRHITYPDSCSGSESKSKSNSRSVVLATLCCEGSSGIFLFPNNSSWKKRTGFSLVWEMQGKKRKNAYLHIASCNQEQEMRNPIQTVASFFLNPIMLYSKLFPGYLFFPVQSSSPPPPTHTILPLLYHLLS